MEIDNGVWYTVYNYTFDGFVLGRITLRELSEGVKILVTIDKVQEKITEYMYGRNFKE